MSRVYIKEHFPYLSGNDNIIIDDSAPVTITQTYERLSEISNLGGVVIDYFQLIQSEDATISSNEIAGELKLISKRFNIPVICTSQLPRTLERRKNPRPVESDLSRSCACLEMDADVVLFFYREGYYDLKTDSSITELIVSKNRYGKQSILPLYADFEKAMFKTRDI